LRRELRSIAPVEATQALLTETLGNLQRQQQSFELELVGMKGRAEAIQNQIKQITERLKGRAEGDEIVRNLQRVVNLRAEQLRRVTDLKVYRTIDEAAKAKAEEELVLAQIELDRAKREAQKGPSDQLDKFSSELADIAISTASIDAKLNYVSRKLDETRKLLAIDVNDAQPLRDRLAAETAALQAALSEVQKRQAELSRQAARMQPVTVEIINFAPLRKSPKKQ
jgi:chromosome segregation ATPase